MTIHKHTVKLITEMSRDVQVHEGGSEVVRCFVVGIFSSAEVENNNKRKYKRDLLEREIKKIPGKG